MGTEEQHDLAWSLGLVVVLGVIFAILAFETGRGLDPSYVQLFEGVFLAGIVGVIVLVLFTKFAGLEVEDGTFTPTFWSTSSARGLADKPYAKLIGMLVLVIIFAGGALATQHSIIPIINPYDSGHLLGVDQLKGIANAFLTGLRSGGYAGAGEDTIGFVVVNSLTLGLLGLSKLVFAEAMSFAPLVITCGLIACAIWAFLFATGHLLAYGINLQAYVGTLFYGFLSQFVNFLVGAPVSIVAHFAHNFAFVIGLSIAFSIWGYAAYNATKNTTTAGLLLGGFRLPSFRPVARRAQFWTLMVWIGVAAFVLLALVWAFLRPHTGGLYDIGSNGTDTCSQWASAPGPVSCSVDADCVTKLVPAGKTLDPGLALRCSAGVCQARASSCGVTVGT